MADNDPVDPFIDPGVPQELPSEVASGFYDNTPVSELQAESLQEVPPPVEEPPLSEVNTGPTSYTPEELDAIAAAQGVDAGDGGNIPESALYRNEAASQNPYNQFNTGTFDGPLFNTNSSTEEVAAALRDQARQQQTISQQRRQINNGDWRVKLRLAPQSNYLYNAPNPGILQPLAITDGVVFPYTPTIDTVYKADYDSYALTHSNYKGYFYKSSYADVVNLRCTFTAQSTSEANYLLAVITFFKSATKMFYGQDAERGAPPPLVYLSGLGDYQFNEHPCAITQFNFNLPSDVDYIRSGSINQAGLNLVNSRDRQSVSASILGAGARLLTLASLGVNKGALPNTIAPSSLGANRPTYVPTKMDISISLLPMQSRKQVSKQFSLKEFANGNLIKGGFW